MAFAPITEFCCYKALLKYQTELELASSHTISAFEFSDGNFLTRPKVQ